MNKALEIIEARWLFDLRASMISSALLIMVAESTVIFRPMVQVGWRRASCGVTLANCPAVAAKRPAAGREPNAFDFLRPAGGSRTR